jgi:GntR family transcriptional regulator
MRPEPQMADPMYRQIAEDLRRQIESGELAEDRQLPAESELMDAYKSSRNTVRGAIKSLVSLGLVKTRPGQGTFVARKMDPFVNVFGPAPADDSSSYLSEAAAQGRRAELSATQVEIQGAHDLVASELRVPEGSQVISRHRQRFIDGRRSSLKTAYYPRGLADRGAQRLLAAEDIAEGERRYIAETLGLRQTTWSATIAARAPDDNEIQFFALADHGVAVVDFVQTCYDQTDSPLYVTITTYPMDRNRFQMTVGDFPSDESSGDSL